MSTGRLDKAAFRALLRLAVTAARLPSRSGSATIWGLRGGGETRPASQRLSTMATVFIPAPLRTLTGGERQLDITAKSVREVVALLEKAYPGLASRLTKDGALAQGLTVSVDGVISNRGLATAVGPESEVHFIPALGGG